MPSEKLTALSQALTNYTPELQRLGVLETYALNIHESRRFRDQMIEAGFPPARLLMQGDPKAGLIPGLSAYQAECLVFNTRYQYQPFAIVMCETTREVQQAYQLASQLNLPIRLRAGGHDHAGESSGDNVILIDVTGIRDFTMEGEEAQIGAGYRFYQLTPELAKVDRMIAHGTCATVGLTGFIQGGGWGPWTRKYGMCCEHLMGAILVRGDGSVVMVHEKGGEVIEHFDNQGQPILLGEKGTPLDATENSDLLWALRGGGGMSYGILTRIFVKTFPLPATIHRFQIYWNNEPDSTTPSADCTTLEVLQTWEDVINSNATPGLLGTNLQINAINNTGCGDDYASWKHTCLMYGYWEGSEDALKAFVDQHFGKTGVNVDTDLQIGAASGAAHESNKYEHRLMSDWGRDSLYDRMLDKGLDNLPLLQGTPFKPDYDAPAPHKITSRFVTADGLKTGNGYQQFLQSLTSPLVLKDSRDHGLNSYVTLGAIQGDFYIEQQQSLDVAFPYRDCQYTIQYQTWWNTQLIEKLAQQDSPVFVDTNRAMDWIDEGRMADIDGTKGAFISFKDPAVPTEQYFDSSYERLVSVKQNCVKDTFNHLRTRKTIV
ncbi:FAD-binding oxidoreductase [Oceanobacter kriegii]|uniref:FAD-binding oxidoreductase n=1 Tax=Oceanobacter kriegii TaxID=64972 RepID=UPI0003F5958F|nr:FAD-binding oxidoreductase [Oceanobacter kriegii]